MNKALIYSLSGVFLISLLGSIFRLDGTNSTVLHTVGLIVGLILSTSTINEVTKSNNSIKSKIYFSFIFSALIFLLVYFSFVLGYESQFNFALPIVFFLCTAGFIISFMTGIILSFKRKNNSFDNYNIVPLTIAGTIISASLFLILFYIF